MRLTAAVTLAALGLASASWAADPAPAAKAAPAAKTAAAAKPKAGAILAPQGTYKLDPNHTSLTFKIQHFGLSNYTAWFGKYDVVVELDPKNLARSTVTATIDPASVRTNFPGDFQAGHKGSPYKTFEEEISKDPKYLNTGGFPAITFKSTKVEPKGKGRMLVTGDLTFLGQTHPVKLEATVTGSIEKHPFTGHGAMGIEATTTFNRSEWGMTGTQQYLGDAVTIIFDGEFQQAAAQESAPKPAN